MSNTGGTCEFVLDPDDPETWGGEEGDECYVDEDVLNEDGVWKCPRDAKELNDRCIFHIPMGDKDNKELIREFHKYMKKDKDQARHPLIGLESESIILKDSRLGRFNGTDVNMKHSNIRNIIIENSAIDVPIQLSGSQIESHIKISESDFSQNINFDGSVIKETSSFSNTNFQSGCSFREVCFVSKVDLSDVSFGISENFDRSNFSHAVFQDHVDFSDSHFLSPKFINTKFEEKSVFQTAKFTGEANFRETECLSEIDFRNCDFERGNRILFDDFTVREFVNFSNISFGGDGYVTFKNSNINDGTFFASHFKIPAVFEQAEFRNNISFENVIFEMGAEFNESVFQNGACFQSIFREKSPDFSESELAESDFSGTVMSSVDFSHSNLSGADFSNANISEADMESALLSRATLTGADLRGARLSRVVLGDVRIDDDTKFLGHPSEDDDISPHTFSAIRSQPTCVYDPDYEEDNEHKDVDKAKSVYRALEELGGKHARPRLQARSFVRRQDLQKKDYWDDATADDASLEERFIAGLRWSRAKVARATLLYGESPWRVIAWSLGIIFSFALLYPLGGWMKPTDGDPITYAQIASNPVEILNSVYYSTLTYTALGFGYFQPVGFGRLLTTVETGLGAVMLALLVFILGRRAAR